MKIKDPKAMGTPRAVCCEWCGKYCRRPTERHHILCRGHGGGKRLDIEINLIDLGGPWDCGCHRKAQSNEIDKEELYGKVAKRYPGETADSIWAEVNRLYTLDKLAKGTDEAKPRIP